jgi:hypothetical protein
VCAGQSLAGRVCKTVGSVRVGSNQTSALPLARGDRRDQYQPCVEMQRPKALLALHSQRSFLTRDAWLHPAEGMQHSEARSCQCARTAGSGCPQPPGQSSFAPVPNGGSRVPWDRGASLTSRSVWALTLFGSGDDHVMCAGRRVVRGEWGAVGQDDRGAHHSALMRFCRSWPRPWWTASSRARGW